MLRSFIPVAKEHGLVGMECFYSLHDYELTNKSISIALEFDLKQSGGSNFHEANKPDIKLGFDKDNLNIPYKYAKEINPLYAQLS